MRMVNAILESCLGGKNENENEKKIQCLHSRHKFYPTGGALYPRRGEKSDDRPTASPTYALSAPLRG